MCIDSKRNWTSPPFSCLSSLKSEADINLQLSRWHTNLPTHHEAFEKQNTWLKSGCLLFDCMVFFTFPSFSSTLISKNQAFFYLFTQCFYISTCPLIQFVPGSVLTASKVCLLSFICTLLLVHKHTFQTLFYRKSRLMLLIWCYQRS